MTVRLLSIQIAQFWELIKYALAQVEKFGSDDEALGVYNRVFASLLNDKSQCFIVYSPDQEVKAVCITEIFEDLITAKRSLNVRCLYAFKVTSDAEWQDGFELIRQLAKDSKCSKIIFQTSNARIKHIGQVIGFKEVSTNMSLEV